MSSMYEFLAKGGPVMVPLGGLSIATVYCALERGFYWLQLLRNEEEIVRRILDAASSDLSKAGTIAMACQHLPIGRFLSAPLQLKCPSPETFRLALEAAADREFVQMRRGERLLETVVALAPLLGLLGTVTGLIITFQNLNVGGASTANIDATKAATGIAEALITTAAGMVVAIIALSCLRFFVSLQASQVDYFAAVGSELELIYRQAIETKTSQDPYVEFNI